MATAKTHRADNTRIISAYRTDNPKLGAKMLSDGRESLFLDYYLGFTTSTSKTGRIYKRAEHRREYLKLYLWQAPRNITERQQNKETLELAKRIRFEQGQRMLENAEGYRLRKRQDINLLDWLKAYHDRYTKKDRGVILCAYNAFVGFLSDTDEYRRFVTGLTPKQLTKEMMQDFTCYLLNTHKGYGAHSVYARFKKMINEATEKGIFIKNPCNGVSIKVDNGRLTKDVLSQEEIRALINTPLPEKDSVRRAFIFCLYTGLRWCDVRDLTFANVDFQNGLLVFEQKKTRGHSSRSGVTIPLNGSILRLIGEGEKTKPLFSLPRYETCVKWLKKWVKRANVGKHITWHCARHSFALNTLNNGANIKTVAELLGHSGLSQTEKYVRAVDSLKRAAVDSLPSFEI